MHLCSSLVVLYMGLANATRDECLWELLQTLLSAGFLQLPQCSARFWKLALQNFPQVPILVAASEACGNTSEESVFFFFFFCQHCCHCHRYIRCDFRGPDKPKNLKLTKVTAAVVLLEMSIDGVCWATWVYLMSWPSLRGMWLWYCEVASLCCIILLCDS